MALLPIHKYFVFNNEVKLVTEFIPSENEGGVYEVIRVEDGVPLFLEDHLNRFFISAKIANKTILFPDNQILELLLRLIEKNKIAKGNILISCKSNLKAFFIAHKYPSEIQYKKGINCGILRAQREKPNAKVFQTTARQRANELIKNKDFYEVVLVDKLGRVTEGSRSNIFFVKGNKVFTPPGKDVLLGITRQKTIALINKLELKFLENDILLEELNSFNAAFITGTSPKILPINRIEKFVFQPENEVIKQLKFGFNNLILDYKNTR